ncbi:C-type lectin domain family 2 member B-like isoform X2 [Tiliqua scincoides]
MAPQNEEVQLQPSTPSPYKRKTQRNPTSSCPSCCVLFQDTRHLGSPEAPAGKVMAPPNEEVKLQPSTPSPYKREIWRNSTSSWPRCCVSLQDSLHLCSHEAFMKFQKYLSVKDLIIVVLLSVVVILACVETPKQSNCELASPAHYALPCPRHWIGYEGKCYYFSREKRSWDFSQNYCSSYNASLARIDDGEKDFVGHFKSEDCYWIGLRRQSGHAWKWPNGDNSTLVVIGGGGNCVYIDGEVKAFSSGCLTELPWICSKPTTCMN